MKHVRVMFLVYRYCSCNVTTANNSTTTDLLTKPVNFIFIAAAIRHGEQTATLSHYYITYAKMGKHGGSDYP